MKRSDSILINSRLQKSNPTVEQKMLQPPTSSQKWWASIVLGMLFAILASGSIFQLSNKVCSYANISTYKGEGPTILGLLLHTIIFTLIVRFILW